MHTNRISPARKILIWLAGAAGLALLAGCQTVAVKNITSPTMQENPSQIYTLNLQVTPKTKNVTTIQPHVVVEGKIYDMKKSAAGEGLYEFEFPLSANRDEIAYYFIVDYTTQGNGTTSNGQATTELGRAKIVRRDTPPLDITRGPVGARIHILGRGFTQSDTIYFSGNATRTTWESPTSLSFIVPALEPGKNYDVMLSSPAGNAALGKFHIDPSTVSVFPQALTLRTKQSQALTFTIPNPAPDGGTLLDITTDVPDSVIMPEVVVPSGATSVTVQVAGGRPGSGALFLKGYGTGELAIPVSVSP